MADVATLLLNASLAVVRGGLDANHVQEISLKIVTYAITHARKLSLDGMERTQRRRYEQTNAIRLDRTPRSAYCVAHYRSADTYTFVDGVAAMNNKWMHIAKLVTLIIWAVFVVYAVFFHNTH